MEKEILLKVDDNIFSLKASGFCFCNNRLLLKRSKNGTYSLPGGNIAFSETSKEAIIRKFSEEIGAVILIDEFEFVSEDFSSKNPPCHEICFYHRVTLLDKELLNCDSFCSLKNSDDVFEWVPLNKVDSLKTKPNNILEILDTKLNSQ